MTIDPATAAFLKILNESTGIHGGNKKESFKGNYGGGNEYYQLEPDTELDNMRERVLGSEIDELNVVPGSMTVNPNNFEKYKSTLQGDLKGENIKPFKYAPPKGFNVVDKKFPKVKQAPKESIEGKELGENKNDDGRRVIDDSMLVDDSENGAAKGSTPSRTSIAPVSQILELPGVLTVGLSESTIEKIDEALDAMIESRVISEMWPFGGKSDPSQKVKKVFSDNFFLMAHVIRNMFEVPRNAPLRHVINDLKGTIANALKAAQQYNKPSKQTVEKDGQSFQITMPAFRGSLSEQEIGVIAKMNEDDLGMLITGADNKYEYELKIAVGNHKTGRGIDIKEAPMWPFGGKSDPSQKVKKAASDNSVLVAHVMRKMFKVPRNASLSQFIRKNGNAGQALADALRVAQQDYDRPSKQTVEKDGQSFQVTIPAFRNPISEQEIAVAEKMDDHDLGILIHGLDDKYEYELKIAVGNHKTGRGVDIR